MSRHRTGIHAIGTQKMRKRQTCAFVHAPSRVRNANMTKVLEEPADFTRGCIHVYAAESG